MENLDVTVILPISSSKKRSFDELFDRSIKSLKNQQLKRQLKRKLL